MPAEQTTVITGEDAYIISNENISIDVSILFEIAGNDKSFVYRTVNTFLKNMPGTLSKIQQSLNNQDWENLYKCAHSAKSSLSVIKAGEMLNWMMQLEEDAKNKTHLDNAPDLVTKIKEEYRLAEEILKEKFQQ